MVVIDAVNDWSVRCIPEWNGGHLGHVEDLPADPPHSEAAVQALLREAGFGEATRFFSSLFWGAWLACKRDSL
jgi:hypothetical protein